MSDLATALAQCLARVQRPGDVYATGTFDQASYQRRVQQRTQDLEQRGRLDH